MKTTPMADRGTHGFLGVKERVIVNVRDVDEPAEARQIILRKIKKDGAAKCDGFDTPEKHNLMQNVTNWIKFLMPQNIQRP